MNDTHWKSLYDEHAEDYELLVQHEDYQGNLPLALNKIYALDHASIVEFGAGTGRITVQLASLARWICAFDLTPSMVRIADRKLRCLSRRPNGLLGIADSRAMPIATAKGDMAVEGWSLVQIMAWHKTTWREEVAKAVDEMCRVVRPGGIVVLIETLGTGQTTPQPPDLYLPVYDYFERERNFSPLWLRTDYKFASRLEARQIIAPIFGEAMLEKGTETTEDFYLPECTGIWWQKV